MLVIGELMGSGIKYQVCNFNPKVPLIVGPTVRLYHPDEGVTIFVFDSDCQKRGNQLT